METQTISAFALERGHDRRTVTRRLLNANIEPRRVYGRARYFAVADMEKLMLDPDDPFSGLDKQSRTLVLALAFLSPFLPDCMERALLNCKISPAKREVATVRLWACLAQVVVNALPTSLYGVPLVQTEAIQNLAAKHGIDLDDFRPLINPK